MSLSKPDEITQTNCSVLLVFDAGGRVQAVSSKAGTHAICDSRAAQKHYAEVFGLDSNLTQWLTEHMNRGRKKGDYSAESRIEVESLPIFVRLESLKCDSELYGFAVQISNNGSAGPPGSVNEGDSVVTRQQWHEIKNHLSGLKLYATFLKRKLPAGDEQNTVEKMLHGVDVLIEQLAKIRRGEA